MILSKSARKWLNLIFPRTYKWGVDLVNGHLRLKWQILRDARQNPELYDPQVVIRLIKFGIEIFPFDGAERYDRLETEVHVDADGFPWVWHEGCGDKSGGANGGGTKSAKKLFFRAGTTPEAVLNTYRRLLKEQDPASPHCYGLRANEGDVVMDVGAAEGIYSLDNVEVASRIILFEVEPEWIGALERTFAPWKDKVLIINKFASDVDDAQNVTIDRVVSEQKIERPILLKLDVEGAENRVISGSTKVLARSTTRAAVCTYHRRDDHEQLSAEMRRRGFEVATSPSRMLFIFDGELRPPFYRRGVIICCK